jgi:hypothetical protein
LKRVLDVTTNGNKNSDLIKIDISLFYKRDIAPYLKGESLIRNRKLNTFELILIHATTSNLYPLPHSKTGDEVTEYKRYL